jgi:3-phenylpropionate/cinnamic acid dioxygenase small subunit
MTHTMTISKNICTTNLRTLGQRLLCTFVLTIPFCGIVQAADEVTLAQQVADRLEIQDVAYRYIMALDTRDADLYVSVFTEDAEYDVEGMIYRGHDQLRGIVLGLQRSRETTIAAGKPVMDLYHTNLNPVIELLSATEAHYQAYWQTLRKGDDNAMRIGGMGRIEDTLVKTNGKWRIKKRVLTNFIQRVPAPQ